MQHARRFGKFPLRFDWFEGTLLEGCHPREGKMRFLRKVTLMLFAAFCGILAAASTGEATPMAGILLSAPSVQDLETSKDLRSLDAFTVEKAYYYHRYHRHYYHRRYYRPYYHRRYYHRRYYGYYHPYYYRRWHPYYW